MPVSTQLGDSQLYSIEMIIWDWMSLTENDGSKGDLFHYLRGRYGTTVYLN